MKTFLITKTGPAEKPWLRTVPDDGGDQILCFPRKMSGERGTGLPKFTEKDGAKYVQGIMARSAAHVGKDGKQYAESHILYIPGY